jgi:hypothetical protein
MSAFSKLFSKFKFGSSEKDIFDIKKLLKKAEKPGIENYAERSEAKKALAEIRDPRAIEPLLKCLKDNSIRSPAIDVLANIGKPAVEPLLHALKDKNDDVRYAAASALRKIGGPEAEMQLAQNLRDKDQAMRKLSYEVLVALKGSDGSDSIVADLIRNDEDHDVKVDLLNLIESKVILADIAESFSDPNIQKIAIQKVAKLDEIKREIDRISQLLVLGMPFQKIVEILGPPSGSIGGSDVIGKTLAAGATISSSATAMNMMTQKTFVEWVRPEGRYKLVIENGKLSRIFSTPKDSL